MPIGEARPWCTKDDQCVLEDGHGGGVCEVDPGARQRSAEREREAARAGVHKTIRDAHGRAVVKP